MSDISSLPCWAVVGYGNSLRRDDGAGPELARRLAAYWADHGQSTQLVTCHQLTPELAEELALPQISRIYFVDAAPASAPDAPVLIRALDAPSPQTLGHHCTPQLVMTYLAHLYACRPTAYLVTIPSHDFDHGQGFSPAVVAALAAVPSLANTLAEQPSAKKDSW